MRYTVEQVDSSTYQVIDLTHHREVCVCGEFEGGSNPHRRAQLICDTLNNNDTNNTPENKAWATAISERICDELHMGLDATDLDMLQKVLTQSLANSPAAMRQLIGTGVIEEEYLEMLAAA